MCVCGGLTGLFTKVRFSVDAFFQTTIIRGARPRSGTLAGKGRTEGCVLKKEVRFRNKDILALRDRTALDGYNDG